MSRHSARLRCKFTTLAFVILVLFTFDSLAYQAQDTRKSTTDTNELMLTAGEEKDSYDIYSLLLKAEVQTDWNHTWVISPQTTTMPGDEGMVCVMPIKEQEAVYLPIINDYTTRNRKKFRLARKFDLPSYEVRGPVAAPRNANGNSSAMFYLSAIGFNPDRTRALVYVGVVCGSLCGSGRYHFLVRKNGRWADDSEYRGSWCHWQS